MTQTRSANRVIRFPGSNRVKINPLDYRLALLGKNRVWLAKKIGLSYTQVSRYARKEIDFNPGSYVTRKVCQVLGLTLDELILGDRGQL